MQIKEAIESVLALKPGYEYTKDSVELKNWLNDCDQMIWKQLISHYKQNEYPEMPDYTDKPNTTELMVPEPYSRLYIHYLAGQISYWNRETTGYINEKEQYTALLNAFIAEYMRMHEHKPMPYFKGVSL